MVVEAFLIIAMTSLNFSIMPRRSGADSFMLYSDFATDYIKRVRSVCFLHMGEFRSVIGL